jgi:hypothetical protein
MQSTHFNLFRKSLSSYDAVANDVVETLGLSNDEEIQTELLDALYSFMENAAAGVNQQNQNCLSWIQSNVQPMKPLLKQASEIYKHSAEIMAGGPSAMLANPAQRTRYAAKHLIMGILQVC